MHLHRGERDIAARRDRLRHLPQPPDDSLVGELQPLGLVNVQAIGDACNPGTIAEAVYSGRLYAEELQALPAGPATSRSGAR